MTEHENDTVTLDELEDVDAELMPDREELSVISDVAFGGFTLPVEPPATE